METSMDAAARAVTRCTESPLHAVGEPAPQSLTALAVFRLSETGRKASLLAGGDGREHQRVPISVPTGRLHLVSVDELGTVRLKLRPRYEQSDDQLVTRIDAPPVYDAPPSVDQLFQHAARNYELERAFLAQIASRRGARAEAADDWRVKLSEQFLADSSQRALVHPSPTVRRCELATERGRVIFDAKRDHGVCRDVPAAAFRRFHADLRTHREQVERQRHEQDAVHAEKRRIVAEWITANGLPDQQARQAAGMLPLEEGIEAIADDAFRSLGDWTRYARDGADRLQRALSQHPAFADVVVASDSVRVTTRELGEATSAQWRALQAIKAAVPGAGAYLRERQMFWAGDSQAPRIRIVTVLAVAKVGALTLRREWVLPEEPVAPSAA
jgi:hypothetical protein